MIYVADLLRSMKNYIILVTECDVVNWNELCSNKCCAKENYKRCDVYMHQEKRILLHINT
jgi:hypothetical protein